MKIKRTVIVLLCVIAAAFGFGGCGKDEGGAASVKVYAPDGAPAIGLAAMIDEGYDAEFKVIPPADIGGKVLKGDADIAIMPTNAAALTYSKGAGYMLAGVTNFGSLYLIANEAVTLESLVGKVVYSIGEGNVPDLVFRYILKSADIEYEKGTTAREGVVRLAYVTEGSQFIAGLSANKMQYGVISEPAATVALGKVSGAVRALDIQQLYKAAADTDGGYPQAALVVKKSFYESNKQYVDDFISRYKQTVAERWAEKNPEKALAAIKKAGSTTVPMLTENIVKGCNLSFVAAADCKQQTLDFFAALESVKKEGETPVGKMPDDKFFMA